MALASQSRTDFLALPLSSFSPVSYSSSRKPFIRPTVDDPVLGSRTRLRFQTTSSAVNWRPLCHLTLRRTRSVHVLRSGLASHFSMSPGRVMLSAPVMVRESRTWRAEFADLIQLDVGGLFRCWQ